MKLDDLDYELPEELIAQRPADRREASRLLVVERATGALHDSRFERLGSWLRRGDTLVVNETRVRPARLVVRRSTGGRVELLIVRPDPEGWRVLARPARRALPGARLVSEDRSLELEVARAESGGERVVRVARGDMDDALRRLGEIPLPPYIHRPPEPADRERYQTVFARHEGAVAAPTAGLHFSAELIAALATAGIGFAPVVLHVGPGTFRPVTEADPSLHPMDPEWYEVPDATAAALRETRARGGRIVAVGTTVVRALETACDENRGTPGPARGWTCKFILPPYEFRAADALITNFHLPRTTLLLLVAAFTSPELLRRTYRHAVTSGYRFYSYGDAMLVL